MKLSKSTIWAIVTLIGSYILCQAVADVGATKLVDLRGVVMPAGTFIFAVTFTLRDLIHKRLGKEWARAAIVLAGFLNVFQAGYLLFVSRLPAPVFYANSTAWSSIFSIVPAITVGSIVAEVCSELLDTEVYHYWSHRFEKFPQWTRVLVSNAVSLPVDSVIFALLAFVVLPPVFGAQATPLVSAWSIVSGQIIWKAIMTVLTMPLIYLVKEQSVFEQESIRMVASAAD